MISVLEAQKLIQLQTPVMPAEAVSLAEAHGQILREPIASAEDLPGFDRSAMDGYAVRADDPADDLEVIAEIRAGQSIDLELQPGQAVRILTGARLPGPGLKVVMQEHVEATGKRILITKRIAASNVRFRGEDARAGEILLQPGTVIDATAAALIASVGKASIRVSRQPRILHLTTGDEIVPPDQTPGPGQIRNSNASLIAGLCRESGVARIDHFHSGDDLAELLKIVTDAKAETYDVILISGGSGQGTYDFSGDLFKHLGATIHVREINVRPGKPLIFGTAGKQVVFGLPGNALSHFVCFHLFVRRALDHLLGHATAVPISAFLSEAMTEPANARETWWPALASLEEGRLECRALPWKSSGDITRLPSANALIQVPGSTSLLGEGSKVSLLLTRSLTQVG
jgi:molybdopterin molybdotransferase